MHVISVLVAGRHQMSLLAAGAVFGGNVRVDLEEGLLLDLADASERGNDDGWNLAAPQVKADRSYGSRRHASHIFEIIDNAFL
ncbi:hypothetical protein GQ57_31040 [Burkholderia sp. MSh2]|nr:MULTISPECIES: hypothetical protein [Burkholderia]KEZ02194.1 hypothetical protein GQ57_31040 [Burkholderia sp. MSh2]